MAKKYLLYIHNDKFAVEPGKSNLVNRLLDAYYAGHTITKAKPATIDPISGLEIADVLISNPDNWRAQEELLTKTRTKLCPQHKVAQNVCALMKH